MILESRVKEIGVCARFHCQGNEIRQPIIHLGKILVSEILEQTAVSIFVFCPGQVFIQVVGLGFKDVGKVDAPSKTHTEIFQERIDLARDHTVGKEEEA